MLVGAANTTRRRDTPGPRLTLGIYLGIPGIYLGSYLGILGDLGIPGIYLGIPGIYLGVLGIYLGILGIHLVKQETSSHS